MVSRYKGRPHFTYWPDKALMAEIEHYQALTGSSHLSATVDELIRTALAGIEGNTLLQATQRRVFRDTKKFLAVRTAEFLESVAAEMRAQVMEMDMPGGINGNQE